MTWHIYLFYVDDAGMAKFGISQNLSQREYQLRWSERARYVNWDTHQGVIVDAYTCVDRAEARSIERYLHDEAFKLSVVPVNRVGGRCEWFRMARDEAIALFEKAKGTSVISIWLRPSEIKMIKKKISKTGVAPSVAAFIRHAVLMGAEVGDA